MSDAGSLMWERACKVIPGGNMLLSKNRNLYSPSLWPTYYSRVKGSRVWDLENKEYIDFSSNGVGACSLGHGNEYVDGKVIEAINKGVMSSLNTPNEVLLAEKLIELHPWADMVRLARTGGEANSIAIRISRASTGRDKVAICGYHGWHDWYLAANINSKENLDDHLLPGLSASGVPKSLENTIVPLKFNNLEDLEKLEDREIGTVKIEVARAYSVSPDYLHQLRRVCTTNRINLIFDECTSGFRQEFGGFHKQYDVCPDMCMLGKALGNGYAITAVLGTEEIMSHATETFISSTFWTEAIGPAAALATLEEMKKLKSWVKLPLIGKKVKNIWNDEAKRMGLPIQVEGIDSLPTFRFLTDKNLEYKTLFTESMLEKGFLATTLFYPTVTHTEEEILLYRVPINETFRKLAEIYHTSNPPELHCKGKIAKPTFNRMT